MPYRDFSKLTAAGARALAMTPTDKDLKTLHHVLEAVETEARKHNFCLMTEVELSEWVLDRLKELGYHVCWYENTERTKVSW